MEKNNLLKKLINNISNILDLKHTSKAPDVPSPLILLSQQRNGLSAIKSANIILNYKQELGLPTGNYDDGTANANDIIILKIFEEVYRALNEDAKITVAVEPGTQLTASGGNSGGPIQVVGTTISVGKGGAVIQ